MNTALVSPEGFDPLKGVAATAARLLSTRNGSQIVHANRVLASLGAVPILDRSGLTLRAIRMSRLPHIARPDLSTWPQLWRSYSSQASPSLSTIFHSRPSVSSATG